MLFLSLPGLCPSHLSASDENRRVHVCEISGRPLLIHFLLPLTGHLLSVIYAGYRMGELGTRKDILQRKGRNSQVLVRKLSLVLQCFLLNTSVSTGFCTGDLESVLCHKSWADILLNRAEVELLMVSSTKVNKSCPQNLTRFVFFFPTRILQSPNGKVVEYKDIYDFLKTIRGSVTQHI